MTVCVATISQGGVILGASDRMLTSGDVEFEPESAKVHALTTAIVSMSAGDASLQAQILADVQAWVRERMDEDSTKWLAVRTVAERFLNAYSEQKRWRAETSLLRPVGLTSETFIARQRELLPELAARLATELLSYEVPAVATIIAGVDGTGAHLFVVADDEMWCMDTVGFCAIGAGANHAQSLLMEAKYVPSMGTPESLLLTFAAKRRAEVAPGVGSQTDMFTVGPQLGSYIGIDPTILTDLGKMYKELVRREKKAFLTAQQKARTYVDEIAARIHQQNQESRPNPEEGGPSTEEGGAGPAAETHANR